MHRELGGTSFAELGLPEGLGRDEELEALHDSLDWAPFERLLRDVYNSREGRKAYPPIVMFKINILQQWYGGASDPAIERALGRDLAFRRFVGLGLNDGQPDHSTIYRFRAQLERDGLAGRLFAELRRQQEAAGLLVREGALLDATRIEAQASTKRLDSAKGPTDPDARFGRDVYGYQMHISADFATGLVCNAALTPGNVTETEAADALLLGGEQFVLADRAYDKAERRESYAERGAEYLILKRGASTIRSRKRSASATARWPSCAAAWNASSAHSNAATATAPCATSTWPATRSRCGASCSLTTYAAVCGWRRTPAKPGPRLPNARPKGAAGRNRPPRGLSSTPFPPQPQPDDSPQTPPPAPANPRPAPPRLRECLLPGGRLGGGWDAANCCQRSLCAQRPAHSPACAHSPRRPPSYSPPGKGRDDPGWGGGVL